jgi:CubicO group peptidase (beta-lactamase class C family)
MESFGSARTAQGVEPMRTDHRFLLTSITKTFTALQLLALVEDGRFSLSTPIRDVIPEFDGEGREEVRLWHVLTHTSGIREDSHTNTAEEVHPDLGPGDHLRAAIEAPLEFSPGTRVSYCSPPFWLLAEMIRRTTTTSHVEHLTESICAPLGLEHTGYDTRSDPPDDYVLSWAEDRSELAEQVRLLAYPAGGIVGDVADLLTYGRMLLSGGRASDGTSVLSPLTISALGEPWTVGLEGPRSSEGVSWRLERGLGWTVGGPGDVCGRGVLWHSGASGTAIWIDQANDFILVLLSAGFAVSYSLMERISNVAFSALSRA